MSTEIDRDTIAFCWSPTKGFHMMLPDGPEDRQMKDEELFVSSCFMAANDTGFYEEMVATLKDAEAEVEDFVVKGEDDVTN